MILDSKGKPANIDAGTNAILTAQGVLDKNGMSLGEICGDFDEIHKAQVRNNELYFVPPGTRKIYLTRKLRVKKGIEVLLENQIKKLQMPENTAKENYIKLELLELLKLLKEEVTEVENAVTEYLGTPDRDNRVDLLAECGDVANYLAMICERIS